MLLTDARLDFGQDLIRHWLAIRAGGELVPLKAQIEPAAMRKSLPFVTIVDVSDPGAPRIALAGTALRQRYGREITGADWMNFVPEVLRSRYRFNAALMLQTPCGIYYAFKITADANVMREVETVALPLKGAADRPPNFSITVSRDIALKGIADAATVETAKVDHVTVEFIDIGAGMPDLGAPGTDAPGRDATQAGR